jgi:Gamma-glutamyl cyclotransferase, AIG2-like
MTVSRTIWTGSVRHEGLAAGSDHRLSIIVGPMTSSSATAPEETLRLFQYGSNMDHGRLVQRIKGAYSRYAPAGTPVAAELLGAARLPGWRLQANLWSARRGCRVLNIVEELGAEVWGALYRLPEALVNRPDGMRSVVDLLEGHRTEKDPENYEKVEINIEHEGRSTSAWTYIGLREAVERCEHEHPATNCDQEYIDTVLVGAEAIGVPAVYLRQLRETLDCAMGLSLDK